MTFIPAKEYSRYYCGFDLWIDHKKGRVALVILSCDKIMQDVRVEFPRFIIENDLYCDLEVTIHQANDEYIILKCFLRSKATDMRAVTGDNDYYFYHILPAKQGWQRQNEILTNLHRDCDAEIRNKLIIKITEQMSQ